MKIYRDEDGNAGKAEHSSQSDGRTISRGKWNDLFYNSHGGRNRNNDKRQGKKKQLPLLHHILVDMVFVIP